MRFSNAIKIYFNPRSKYFSDRETTVTINLILVELHSEQTSKEADQRGWNVKEKQTPSIYRREIIRNRSDDLVLGVKIKNAINARVSRLLFDLLTFLKGDFQISIRRYL